MSVGDISTLELIEWDWFVSCTTAVRGASDVFLTRKAFAFMRCTARLQHVYFPDLPWALRLESGTDPNHRHFHLLIGSLPKKSENERFRMMAKFEMLLGGTPDRVRGTCRIRLYSSADGLAEYIAKACNRAEADAWGRGEVVVSNSAFRIAWRNSHMKAARVG